MASKKNRAGLGRISRTKRPRGAVKNPGTPRIPGRRGAKASRALRKKGYVGPKP